MNRKLAALLLAALVGVAQAQTVPVDISGGMGVMKGAFIGHMAFLRSTADQAERHTADHA